MNKKEIEQCLNIMLKEIILARKSYTIFKSIVFDVNESNFKLTGIPISNSLITSTVISLYNVFSTEKNTINFIEIVDQILKCSEIEKNEYDEEFYKEIKGKINSLKGGSKDGQKIIKVLDKLFIHRNNKYGHTSIKMYTTRELKQLKYQLFFTDVEELLDIALDIIKELYKKVKKENIMYSKKDDECIELEVKKIKYLLGEEHDG